MAHPPTPTQGKGQENNNIPVILPGPPSNLSFHLPSVSDIEKGLSSTPSATTFSNSDKDSGSNSKNKNDESANNNKSSSLLLGIDADGWKRIVRGTIVTAIGVGLFCTPVVREFVGGLAWILLITTLVYTAMGPQMFGFIIDRAIKMELVVCAICCLSLLAVYTSNGNSFAMLAWLCIGAYPMGLLASYDLSWFGAAFLGTIYYYFILFESYDIALKQANAEDGHGDGNITSHISKATMIDNVKESCLSIILATIIGTAIVVAVNGLFLSEYGTTKFEKTVRAKILPQLGSVLQLAVDTQLNGCRDRNADHKDSTVRKELYDARTELQTMASPLSTCLMAARLELRFYNPSKGERMTKLFDTVNELVGRVLAVTHVLCAEENEASKELWRDAFGEVDAFGRCIEGNITRIADDAVGNQGRRDLTTKLNAHLESSLKEFNTELQKEINRLSSMLTEAKPICTTNDIDDSIMMKINALSSNVEERLCDAVRDVVATSKQQEEEQKASKSKGDDEGNSNKPPTMMYWFIRSEGKRTAAFIHGMRTLILPLTNFRKAVVLSGSQHRRESNINGTMNRNESFRNEWKKTFPFVTTPERVDWLDEIEYTCDSSKEKEEKEKKMDHSKYTKSTKKFLARLARFLHSDHANTTFKFILALAISAGFSYFPNSYIAYDDYGMIAMVSGIISLGMRVEVGWYLNLTLLRFLGLLAAMAWALIWYAVCFVLPMTPAIMTTGDDNAFVVEATSDAWYTNAGLALMQTGFFVAVSIFTTKNPSYAYSGLMANVLFVMMTAIPMGVSPGKLESFRSFGIAAGWRLVGSIAGALVMTLVGVLINPVYAYKRVSTIMADIISDTSLTLTRSITVPMELDFDDGDENVEGSSTLKKRCQLVRDIGQSQAWAKLQIGDVQRLLEASRFEVQLEDNGRYDSKTAQQLLGHINSSITNIQHMVLLSPDYSELIREQGMVIAHEQWFVNRMTVLQFRAAESSLRSIRPLVPAYPSNTFDAPRRFDAYLTLRRQNTELIMKGKIHEATRQMARSFFTILLIHDVARIEALISSMYGNRSKKYLQSLETNTRETYDDQRMAGVV